MAETKIELTDVLKKYPRCKTNFGALRGTLRDLYPENVRDVNLLLYVFACGFVQEMKDKDEITPVDIKRYTNFMEKQYGTKVMYSKNAVLMWADALGVKHDGKVTKPSKSPEKKTSRKRTSEKEIFTYGDECFTNSELGITYTGYSDWDGLFAQGHKLHLIVENKTKGQMKVRLKNIAINGIVIEQDERFGDEISAHTKYAGNVLLNRQKLMSVGAKSIKSVKEIAFEIEYSFMGGKRKTGNIKVIPYIIQD